MSRLGNRLPTCLACLRRLAQPSVSPIQPPTGVVLMQTRAKSNHMRPQDRGVVVRLLEDIPTFGRKHAVFRTERGRMRNQWYPANKAEYMTRQRFQELGLTEEDVGDRDRAFAALGQADEDDFAFVEVVEKQQGGDMSSKMPVTTAHTLISTLTPETLTFYRKVIEKPASENAEKPRASRFKDTRLDIYGSVSTNDIANRIKEFLVTDAEGRMVTLQPQDISIIGLEGNALKTIGHFGAQIMLGGSEDTGVQPVLKVVEILPEKEGETKKH
ncbi:hypothetical protein V8F33_008569 [Rhypophila sp. PSN 637]